MNTGNNLLYLLVAALLGIMCSTGVAGWLNVRGLDVELLPPPEIYCQLPTAIRVRITNRKRWLPSFLLVVPLADNRCAIHYLPPKTATEQVITCSLPVRGWHQFPRPWVQSSFPAGFFIRSWPAGTVSQCLVLPQPIPTPLLGTNGRHAGSMASLNRHGWDGDLRAISPYTGQEPRKLINWRLSARHDRLLVRQLETLAAEPVTINLDTIAAPEREMALGRAVFQINHCWQLGRPVGLVANGVNYPPQLSAQQRLLLLREVALYGL